MSDISWLFETEALKISAADQPFFYTSGLIGPYYVNTHFLAGGQATAHELLRFIDHCDDNPAEFPKLLLSRLQEIYEQSEVFRNVIAAGVDLVKQHSALAEIDFVSGGQRRDWFFAPLLAQYLDKRCLYLFKDGSCREHSGAAVNQLGGRRGLHAADLLTVGSSYIEKWIPIIQRCGGSLESSFNVVDRCQGGAEGLRQAGVKVCPSLYSVDAALFDEALEREYIDASQHELVKSYLSDPYNSMRRFLLDNPGFIESARNRDDRTRERVQKLIEENLYNLK